MTALHELVERWRVNAAGGDEARPCACGRMVIANPTDPTAGVRDHQGTDHHRRWAAGVYGYKDPVADADRRARAVGRTRAYKARLRADVEAIRSSRA